jgi:hypothetical protein
MSNTLYDRDFYGWASEQARLLRAGRLSEADVDNIAEEIESMGRSEKREPVSRLEGLLMHLLKWAFQPERRGRSWEVSIANNRDKLEEHLLDNPSLRSQADAAVVSAYRRARREAALETELPESAFPSVCPWSYDEAILPDFWPDRVHRGLCG